MRCISTPVTSCLRAKESCGTSMPPGARDRPPSLENGRWMVGMFVDILMRPRVRHVSFQNCAEQFPERRGE